MTPRAWLLVGLAVAVLVASALAYRFGTRNEHNANQAAKVAVVEKAIEKHNEAAVVGHATETQTIAREKAVDAYFRGLRSEAPNVAPLAPFAVGCVLDDRRLRKWLAANAGPKGNPAGAPDDAGRPAAAPEERDDGGSLRQPSGGDAAVLDAADAVPRPGPVAGEN